VPPEIPCTDVRLIVPSEIGGIALLPEVARPEIPDTELGSAIVPVGITGIVGLDVVNEAPVWKGIAVRALVVRDGTFVIAEI